MASQIVLSWDVFIAGTTLSPAQAVTALAAIVLYQNTNTDPVLGQHFGLTVGDDDTVELPGLGARRTLTLNMDRTNAPTAPPPFPCHPRTSTPPELPYPLRRSVTLPGSFFLELGNATVDTTQSQIPSLEIGDPVQFLNQLGVFYEVMTVNATDIVLTAPYTGVGGNSGAFVEEPAPVTIAAFYSSSDEDTAGVATDPAIPAGPGARTVRLTYNDSAGGGPFTATVSLTGRRPAAVTLDVLSVDIAEIVNIEVMTSGGFANSIGQITLAELSEALPPILSNRTPDDFLELTEEAQLLISNALAYLPPSYPALAGQQNSQADPPAPPSDDELSAPLGEFVEVQVAAPPPNPPFPPGTVAPPTFLSGLYTKTIQLALAGVRITANAITIVP